MASPVRLSVPTPADMHALGRDLARLAQPGDLILLDGELGAGKTQLAQGIGEALCVIGPVISPTFVLARIHRSNDGGLGMVHVDAYRLGGTGEIDDLDLESHMANCVTVIEWGKGVAEHLSSDRLEVGIRRGEDPDDDTREVEVTPVGSRWENLLADWERLVDEDMGRNGEADARGADDE